MSFGYFRLPPELFGLYLGLFALAQLVMAFLIAWAVSLDAQKRRHGSGLFLVGPWMWFFIVLLTGGYIGGLAYWLIHYSTLRHRHEHGA